MSKSVTPLADEQVRKVLEFGAKKHGNLERNDISGKESLSWYQVLKAEGHILSARHLVKQDEETRQHPFAHAIARLLIALEYELRQEKE